MIVMALDLGTLTGLAVGPAGGRPLLVTASFQAQARRGRGPLWAAFADWLWDNIEVHKPKVLGFEAALPAKAQRSSDAARVAFGLVSHVEEICDRASLPCAEQEVGTIRKLFAGKGNATKDDIKAECRRRGWTFDTDNAADAAAVWAFTCHHRAPVARAA